MFRKGDQIAWIADDPRTGDKFLAVNSGGDGNDWEHADWINPVLYGGNDSTELTSLRWIKATTGWDETHVNKSVSGADLIVAGKKYEKGIGIQTNSVMWSGKDLGAFSGSFNPMIKRHGSGFYRISLVK